MLAFPGVPVRSLTITSEARVAVSAADSGRRTAVEYPGQRWSLSIATTTLHRDWLSEMRTFLFRLRGRLNTFTFTLPASEAGVHQLGGQGLAQVRGANQTGTTLETDGWLPGRTVLAPGTYFKLANHPKVYMLEQAAVSDALGRATLSFTPELYAVPADGELLEYQSVPFTLALRENLQSIESDANHLGQVTVEAIEAL